MFEQINTSGLIPVEYKCVVQIDEIKRVTAGGIHLPGEKIERDEMAQVKGTLLAVGGNAFSDWNGKIPAPGDKVMIAKYAGLVVNGFGEIKYRIISDKDIAAVLS